MKTSILMKGLLLAGLVAGLSACATGKAAIKPAELNAPALAICEKNRLDPAEIARLEATPLYQMKEAEVGRYLTYVHEAVPDLRTRVVHLARKNLGQPYELYLLGEAPFETHDPQPLYCIDRSDCVVFCEHTYAMALGHDWPSFFATLQRIRYRNGEIGVATRNHYTEADWDVNNTWLVGDLTKELAGDRAKVFEQKIDRAKFLRNRYKIDRDFPVQVFRDEYIPLEAVGAIKDKLKDGDFVNFVRGTEKGGKWVGHVGLVAHAPDGTVTILHSTPPRVIEQPLDEIVAKGIARAQEYEKEGKGKAYPVGFKFLRLEDDPLANLRAVDGDSAPRVVPPRESAAKK